MNVQIGTEDCKGDSLHISTNRNGEFLLNFTTECALVNLGTNYCKPKGKLWTFTYPGRVKIQIHHILIKRKWKISATDCRSYNSLASDHRPCTAKIRLSLRANKSSKKKQIKHDWSKLVIDENVKTAYIVDVKNRFEQFQVDMLDKSADSTYNNMIKAHTKAAEPYVPERARSKRRLPWENEDVCKKRKALYNAFEIKKNDHNAKKMMRVEEAETELDKAYSMEQKRYVEEKISIIETADVNHQARLVWATVYEVTGPKKSNEIRIRANSPEERLKLWNNHFEQLLGQPPVLDDQPIERVFNTLPIETGDFNIEELQKSINALQNKKAHGLDDIPIETWKTGCLNEKLLEICNKTFHGDVPGIWL